jgi:hypothetical protein
MDSTGHVDQADGVAGEGLVVAYLYQSADAGNVADRNVGKVDDEVAFGGQVLLDRADELVCVGQVEFAGQADAQAVDAWVCMEGELRSVCDGHLVIVGTLVEK